MAKPRRPEVRGNVDPDTLAAWDRWLASENMTTAGALEAMGRALKRGWRPPKRIVDEAKAIDRERKSRR